MDLQKICVKFFAEDPRAVRPVELIPVFHRWIQTRAVDGMLIDVADYSHVPHGPGVALIGHEADYALDSAEGPLGLLYSRKTPVEGTLADRFRAAFRAALAACEKLEQEPELKGRLRFRGSEALVLANDRLLAPNEEPTFAAIRADLEAALGTLWPGVKPSLRREAADPRRRFAVRVGKPL